MSAPTRRRAGTEEGASLDFARADLLVIMHLAGISDERRARLLRAAAENRNGEMQPVFADRSKGSVASNATVKIIEPKAKAKRSKFYPRPNGRLLSDLERSNLTTLGINLLFEAASTGWAPLSGGTRRKMLLIARRLHQDKLDSRPAARHQRAGAG